MGESNKQKNFEAILKTHKEKEKQPLALYRSDEKHFVSLSSNVLKPKDVIATVSKQLKDIQKADSLKKERVDNFMKHRQTDFVSITDLYNQEYEQVTKFETQCVTDSQLINIVDNVEAMVNVDNGICHDFQKNTGHKDFNSKRETPTSNNFLSLYKYETNSSKELNNIKFENEIEIGVDEINTEIYKEFDTSYSETHDDNASMNNSADIFNKQHSNNCKSNVEFTTKNFAGHIKTVGKTNICNYYNDTITSIKKKEKKPFREKCDKKETNTKKECDESATYNDNINNEFCSFLETNINTPEEMPSSPIFKSFKSVKSKAPSPLIFPLEFFEKFESLAMPLVVKNIDFELTKHLINSQIIDNQLLTTGNAVPILKKTTDNLISGVNNPSEELLEDIRNENYPPETLIVSKQAVSTSFKDENLFSSDEENDYYSEKLPMTCALKTSFQESDVDRDETIYVGFQTSSDKCIQVSKDSYIKAKNMLDSIDDLKNDNLSLTELVDIYDTKISRFNNNLPLKQFTHKDFFKNNENVRNYTSNILESKDKDNVNDLEKTDLIVFKTANGKTINVSDKALIKCQSVFKDIEENMCDYTDDVLVSNAIAKKREFMGFKTASNKSITISEQSLVKTKNIFGDLDLNLNIPLGTSCNIENTEQDTIQVRQNTNQNPIKNENLLANNYTENNDDCINIVDQTLLQEFQNDSIEEPMNKNSQADCNTSKHLAALKTAGQGNENAYAYLRYKKDRFNKDTDCVSNSEPNVNFDTGTHVQDNAKFHRFLGFKTANNKKIRISSEAFVKTKNLFHDIGFEDISNNDNDPLNNPGDYLTDKVTNNQNKKLANNNNNDCSKLSAVSRFHEPHSENLLPTFQGFKDASNKVIKISKEALLKTEKIFQDFDSIGICNMDTPTKGEEETNDWVKYLNKDKMVHISFQGFKTASNKSVEVSEAAVAKSKKLFEDISKDILSVDPICDVNSVHISNSNMCNNNIIKPTYVTKEKDKLTTNPKSYSKFDGFKTANNKPVTVSAEAFDKTRRIFENIDDIGNKNDGPLKSSELVNLKTISDKTNNSASIDNIVKIKNLNFQGFKTASDKHVAISEDALTKTKKLFANIDSEFNIPRNREANERSPCFETVLDNNSNSSLKLVIEEQMNNIEPSKGFRTASNKRVKISDEAIARSREIFDEVNFDIQSNEKMFHQDAGFINDAINKERITNASAKDKDSLKYKETMFGFKTATNKPITISEDSIKKSRQLFSDLDNNFKDVKKGCAKLEPKKAVEAKNNVDIYNAVDTQLINNFEESLHTEDFYKDTTPKQSKRSGSPILSCPKAKKRKKFETPYRNDGIIANIEKGACQINKQSDAKYTFSENYKKTKIYCLKDLDKSDKNNSRTVIEPYILKLDFDTLLNFEFEGSRNDVTDVRWSTDNIKTCFVESVDKKIIPEGWLDNHLKLIIWKLISYEIRFPNVMRGVCSVRNILEQIKYRYDKELHRVERPALRKLLEKDDISTRTMILAVVGVYVDGIKVQGITNSSQAVELLVTDGWYCVKACTDRMIARLVNEGKIAVGRKIATVGAELLNCEQGISPWEDTSAVRLKLFGNSTRPARWDARLGFHSNGSILTQLSSIEPSGGKVCKTRVLVVRVYPALYVEKLEDGSTVTRSERLEHLHQVKYEAQRQAQLEKLYEDMEKDYFDQESSESETMDTDLRKSHPSGSQLHRLMKKSNEASQLRSGLTDSQGQLLEKYSSRRKEKIVEELQKTVQDKIQAHGLHLSRNVIPLLKIRVASFEGADFKVSKAMVSIWRPSDAIFDVVKEGAWIDLFNVVPTAVRNSEIQISAGRQSVFHRCKYKQTDKIKPFMDRLQRKCFIAKDLNKNPAMQTDFNEVDAVGIVFLIEPSLNDFETIKGQQFQNVYLTDAEKNFICINFWGGIKKFGYENIFDTGNVVACINLQKRAGNTRKNIPQYRATELTVITKAPKLDHVRNMTDELIKKLVGLDTRKFCDDCIIIKNNYTIIKQSSEISPYRINNGDYSLTRNKIFIDSPLAQSKDINLNLTGLDFESTFKQVDTQLSPATLKRKQIVKEKIAKLKMYGEPPPLSKIHIVNKSINAGSAYKSPLTSNVASVKNVDNDPTTNIICQSSPVTTLNRTFLVRTGVHPVKLNFSATSADDKVTNPFEEEFEASPPLSLD